MTLAELKAEAATILDCSVADFTVNGSDIFVAAANRVRRKAELANDFEFQRKLVTVSVDGASGASLDDAVIYGTSTTVSIKTILDVGQFDENGNLRPVTWTTTGESLVRTREQNPRAMVRYPRDGDITGTPLGGSRFEFVNRQIKFFPIPEDSQTFTIGMEVYVFDDDWSETYGTVTLSDTDIVGDFYPYGTYNNRRLYLNFSPTALADAGGTFALWYTGTKWVLTDAGELAQTPLVNYWDLASTATAPDGAYTPHGTFTGTPDATSSSSTSNIWTNQGAEYILWGSIVELNHKFKTFVPRQEGNLPPPVQQMNEGLNALITWDIAFLEQHRRHNR